VREKLKQIKGVDGEVVDKLEGAGYESVLEISDEDANNLSDIEGISEKTSNKIKNELPEAKLTDINSIGKTTAESLNKKGFESVSDIKSASIEELSDVEGIGETKAKKIINDINENLDGRLASRQIKTNNVSVFTFKSTLASLITAIILTGLIWSGLLVEFGPISMQELVNGNVSSTLLFSLQSFGFFLISMTVGTGISHGIWYRLMTPNPVSSDLTYNIQFISLIVGGIILGLGWGISYLNITATHIGSIWVVIAGMGSILVFVIGLLARDGEIIGVGIIFFVIYAIGLTAGGWVADNFSLGNFLFILSYTIMGLFLVISTSASFHEGRLGDYKEKKAESKEEYEKLRSRYTKLKSDAPESVNIDLEIEDYRPNDETGPEETLKQINKADEELEEINSKINSHYLIQKGIENLEANTEEFENHIQNNNIEKSDQALRKIERGIENVESKTTKYGSFEFGNRLKAVNNQLEEIVERFVQILEEELRTVQSELQQAESFIDEKRSKKGRRTAKKYSSSRPASNSKKGWRTIFV